MIATRDAIEDLVMRVQNDFLEHPARVLTPSLAQQRFGIDERTCAGVFGALIEAGVLSEGGGTYRRRFPHADAHRAA